MGVCMYLRTVAVLEAALRVAAAAKRADKTDLANIAIDRCGKRIETSRRGEVGCGASGLPGPETTSD